MELGFAAAAVPISPPGLSDRRAELRNVVAEPTSIDHRIHPFIHIRSRRGTTFRAALQVIVFKRDIRKLVRRRTFLLT